MKNPAALKKQNGIVEERSKRLRKYDIGSIGADCSQKVISFLYRNIFVQINLLEFFPFNKNPKIIMLCTLNSDHISSSFLKFFI